MLTHDKVIPIELQNLNITIVEFVLPKIKQFLQIVKNEDGRVYPPSFPGMIDDDFPLTYGLPDGPHKKWIEILEDIIFALDAEMNGLHSDNLDRYERGCAYFGRYLGCLWL